MLVAVLEFAAECGVPSEQLTAGLGFNLEDLKRGGLLSSRQAWQLLRRALKLSGRPDFGLELGRRENLSHFGLPGSAMRTARTLGEATEVGIQYQRQTGALTDAWLEVDGTQAVLLCQSRLRDRALLPFVIEEAFASIFAVARQLVGPSFRLTAMEFAYPAPRYMARYREIFDCPMRFGAPENRCVFESHWLDVPLAEHAPATSLELRAQLERLSGRSGAAQIIAALEQVLSRTDHAAMSIEEAAVALCLSERTLRRRLAEAGATFKLVSDRVRANLARQLLQERGFTVTAASEHLGFSDARAFRRAFKRWLGQTPAQTRQGQGTPGY
ncbi:AraC family transcriptional regulator [Dyella solisilvae]|nr:AraC family transcriptional regulator [Dyella solisilvae]